MKYVDLYKSKDSERHKYTAVIHTNGDQLSVKFGDNRYDDFTTHKDPLRRKRYIKRHAASNREDWSASGYDTAGYWSRWLLWEKDSLKKAINFMRDKKNIDITLRRKKKEDRRDRIFSR